MTEPRTVGRQPMWRLRPALPMVHVLVIDIADLADGGHAVDGHVAQLAGGEADQGVSAFLSHQLSHNAGGTGQLGALAGVAAPRCG